MSGENNFLCVCRPVTFNLVKYSLRISYYLAYACLSIIVPNAEPVFLE